jgi:hypothetical protein
MDIEHIEDNTRIVYHILARLEFNHVLLHISGADLWKRSSRRERWHEVTYIYADKRSPTGYLAYDIHEHDSTPVNHRDYQLDIPDDVRVEAIQSIVIAWEDKST